MPRTQRRRFRVGPRDEPAGPRPSAPTGGRPTVGAAHRPTACAAPSAAMYLDQNGDVRACCWNALHPLGNVADASLSEIWFGDRADELRRAVAGHDYSLGCHACAQTVARGHDALVFARTFDRLPIGEPLGYPSEISFAMSNTCNLQCVMCRGEWSSSIRFHREHSRPSPDVYDDRFFSDLREFLPHLRSAKFSGRALPTTRDLPHLGPDDRTRCEHSLQRDHQCVAVEPPGRAGLLDEHPISITVSIDGISKGTYEAIRVGARHADFVQNIARFHESARRRGTEFSFTWCLMPENWHEFADYLLLADRFDCDAGVNTVPWPKQFNIERLPVPELEAIVAALERQERTHAVALSRNRHVWDHHLERLRYLVSTGSDGTTVWIGAPTDGPSNGPSDGPPDRCRWMVRSTVRARRSVAGPPCASPSSPWEPIGES
ncbi:MAG: SPASM domain-containing protein [Actinobacteria bacterium]|nr:SPASM domain-containing protein [Actinomycetota bacterium]